MTAKGMVDVALSRKLLLWVLGLAIALAPALASAAALSKHHAVTSSASSGAMPDCHKTAPAPGKANHCKHCADDSSCSADVCALKCFKVVADFKTPRTLVLTHAVTERPALLHAPPDWRHVPPAPPPRF